MTRLPVPAPIILAAALFAAPASAQDAGDASAPPPPAWSVQPDEGRGVVQIARTAANGAALFSGGCSRRGGAVLLGAFSRYSGDLLQRTDDGLERTLFEVRGEEWKDAFAVQLRYSARTRSWVIEGGLAPVFLDSFARGRDLVVLNSRRQVVLSFDLTGSSNAARTMRSVCAGQPGTSSTSSLVPR